MVPWVRLASVMDRGWVPARIAFWILGARKASPTMRWREPEQNPSNADDAMLILGWPVRPPPLPSDAARRITGTIIPVDGGRHVVG